MKTFFTTLVISISLLFIPVTHAQTTGNFCERIKNHEDAIRAEFDVSAKTRTELEKKQDEELAVERQKQDESFATARLETDAQFGAYIASLREKAGKNETRLEAIDAFENAIVASRKSFRNTVADIIDIFRKSMDDVLQNRRSGLTATETSRRTQFDTAIASAKEVCTDENTSKSVQDNLKKTLLGIRDTFRTDLAKVEADARKTHNTAIETRKSGLIGARDARKQAVEVAALELRNAWH